MPLHEIKPEDALAPGASLWVIPELEESPWAQKIDWYLNLQLLRAKSHQTKEMPAELETTLKEVEFEISQVKPNELAPFMVAPNGVLPANQIVVLKAQDPKAWVTQARQIWLQLQSPAARVFLPSTISASDIKKWWTMRETDADVSVVS